MDDKDKFVLKVENTVDIIKALRSSKVKRVNIAYTDLDGIWRSKVIPVSSCISQLEDNRFLLCDLVLAWNPLDIPYPASSGIRFTSYQTGFPDLELQAVSRLFILPFDPDMAVLLLEVKSRGANLCPRNILKNKIQQLAKLGHHCKVGIELEFWIFGESLQSIKNKKFSNLDYFSEGNYTWSGVRSTTHSEFYGELFDFFASIGIPILAIHTETGPGAMEICIEATNPLEMADNAILVKNFVKIICARKGLFASFIAKWDNSFSGSGAHLHYSLMDNNKNPVFYDPSMEKNISQTMLHSIGGQIETMQDLMILGAPNINSYARLSPYYFCPCTATWGYDNRTVGLRALIGSKNSQRLEYRVPGADANPYLTISSILAASIYGIENKITPPPPLLGSAYDNVKSETYLPPTLENAANQFQQSKKSRELYGDEFVDHYAKIKRAEALEYARSVNVWQLDRYLDFS